MGDDHHGQIFLVAKAVRLALNDAYGVVQSLDATQRDFVLGLAIGSDTVPMTFDHGREFLEGFKPLPAQTALPVLEEASCPTFAFVVPELAEGLLEQIGGVEPLVGREQGLERLPAIEVQVLTMRQQGIAVTL